MLGMGMVVLLGARLGRRCRVVLRFWLLILCWLWSWMGLRIWYEEIAIGLELWVESCVGTEFGIEVEIGVGIEVGEWTSVEVQCQIWLACLSRPLVLRTEFHVVV